MADPRLPHVWVSFDLDGTFDPDLVSTELGIEPTSRGRKGDPIRADPPRGRRTHDRWRVTIGPRDTLQIDAMLSELRAGQGEAREAHNGRQPIRTGQSTCPVEDGPRNRAGRLSFAGAMTAKEQLRERIEMLTEHEAERSLRLLDDLRDPLTVMLDDAPLDDEPVTPEEEAAVAEADADIAAGRTVSLDDVLREFE